MMTLIIVFYILCSKCVYYRCAAIYKALHFYVGIPLERVTSIFLKLRI